MHTANETSAALNETSPSDATETKPATRKPRGFAAMDRDKVRAIASSGGRSAHAQGLAHRFTPDEARAAGKKGGSAPHSSRGGRRKAEA